LDLVKAASFHDNGKVQQVGFIKMGNYKEWISYDSNGYKTAAYDNGQNRKMVFWAILF
jgi:hypothetical protein